jgi:hypothetical protein
MKIVEMRIMLRVRPSIPVAPGATPSRLTLALMLIREASVL